MARFSEIASISEIESKVFNCEKSEGSFRSLKREQTTV